MNETHKIGFGGGCHWCTEAVFASVRGVTSVAQGWICAATPNDGYSEAVLLSYAPAQVPLAVLVEMHIRTHSSRSRHALRDKYRSAVYVFDDAQRRVVEDALAALDDNPNAPLITQALPFAAFRESPPRYQNYYRSNPERPFCRTYIDPKLALLRSQYGGYVAPPPTPS